MSLKAKLVSIISAFTLVLGMLIMGVLAVSQVNVNMGGNISFTADDVYAHVTGSVTGATVPPSELNVTYSATQVQGDDTVWKKLDLNFDTSATPVVFSITVENLSTERTLTVTLTDTISAETPNLLKTIKTTSGAYISGDIITLDPQGQANDTVEITLTLSVEDKNTSLSNASFSYDLQLFDASVAPEPPVELTGFTFTTSGSEGTLTSYTGSEANVFIPSTFSIEDGKFIEGSDYTVTAIGDDAFKGNSNLQSVTIPDSVISIGEDAFYNCSNLVDVTLSDNLMVVGNAFYNCNSLSYTTSGYGRYLGSSSNDYLALISTTSTTFSSLSINSNCKVIGGRVCFNNSNITRITIPNGVRSICEFAFSICRNLATITIPDSVVYMDGAFLDCSSSAYTTKDNGRYLKTTDDSYFMLVGTITKGFTSFTIDESCQFISGSVFYGVDLDTGEYLGNLTSITIPAAIKVIGEEAFYGNYSLATVTIDSGDIYNDVTSETACGGLIDYATTIRVSASIINGGSYTNSYLNGTTFTKSPNAVDGYYVFTRN